jgi:hypothetical protein
MMAPQEGPPLVSLETPRRVTGFFLARYIPELMMGGAAMVKRTLQRLF